VNVEPEQARLENDARGKWHTLRSGTPEACEAHWQCSDISEPKRRQGLPLRPMPTRETWGFRVVNSNKWKRLRHLTKTGFSPPQAMSFQRQWSGDCGL